MLVHFGGGFPWPKRGWLPCKDQLVSKAPSIPQHFVLYGVQILIYNTAATSFAPAPDNLHAFIQGALQKGNVQARS